MTDVTTPPPIIPGPSEPITLSSVLPASPPPPRWRWFLPAVVTAGLVLIVAGAVYGFTRPAASPAAAPTASPTPTSTPIRDAYFYCGQVGEVSDQDHTIVLDTLGGTPLSKASVADVNCILRHLGAPDFIFETMKKTRAIDGRQHGQWSTFEASWTYHPDQGLDVIIHDSSGP